MNTKLLRTRLEIVLAVLLVVIVIIGIAFFIFKAVPVNDSLNTDTTGNPPGLPVENINYLDVSGKIELTLNNKTLSLPLGSVVISGYNNTSASDFSCIGDNGAGCTIYDIDVSGTTSYISTPYGIKLKSPVATLTDFKKLLVAGEQVNFSYGQRKFLTTIQDSDGNIKDVKEDPTLTAIEEVYGCTASNICFESGRLSEDKTVSDQQVAQFENFVQSLTIN
ncbi:MAG: hypothetical protein ABI721_03195 [Candidatus Dojkabacteria bacterium]